MTSPTEDASSAPHSADSRDALIRQLREELIKTQMIVLELNDRILEKETARADAIAILGRVELVLEQKIDYIVELDQALNARIRELQTALAAAEDLDRQRLTIIQDHVQKIDAANQEIGRVHTMAGEFTRDLSLTRETLATETAAHQKTRDELAASAAQLDTTNRALAAAHERLADTQRILEETQTSLNGTRDQLHSTQQLFAAERHTTDTIKASLLWRLGRPWRALFGPKA